MMAPGAAGFHHVSLSVRDLGGSAGWYERVFMLSLLFEETGEERNARVYRVEGTGAMLGLVEHVAGGDEGFRPERVGLDHLALAVSTRAAVDQWAEHLDSQGVAHSGVIDVPVGAICNFRDPDGIQLAVFWEDST